MTAKRLTIILDIAAIVLAFAIFTVFATGCVTTPTDDPVTPPVISEKHQASFLFDNASTRVMNILSPSYPEEKFHTVVNRCVANGDTEIYLFLINQGDGEWANYSFYKNNDIGGEINYNTVDMYYEKLDYIIECGLSPVLWCRADDSPTFNKTPEAKQKKYQEDAVKLFEMRAIAFCVGLELNEYFSTDQIKKYYDHLDSLTDLPVGIHLTSLNSRTVNAVKPKRFYGQYGFGKSASQVGNETKNFIPKIPGVEFYGAEYNKSSDSEAAKTMGDIILANGALGVGNGAH